MSPFYSVSVRLQRITTESAHVSVPITAEMLLPRLDDSTEQKIDVEKLVATAVQLGAQPSTSWESDGESVIRPHPIQSAAESSRT